MKEKWTGIPAVEMADLMRKAKAAGMSMTQFMASPPTDSEIQREISLANTLAARHKRGRSK